MNREYTIVDTNLEPLALVYKETSQGVEYQLHDHPYSGCGEVLQPWVTMDATDLTHVLFIGGKGTLEAPLRKNTGGTAAALLVEGEDGDIKYEVVNLIDMTTEKEEVSSRSTDIDYTLVDVEGEPLLLVKWDDDLTDRYELHPRPYVGDGYVLPGMWTAPNNEALLSLMYVYYDGGKPDICLWPRLMCEGARPVRITTTTKPIGGVHGKGIYKSVMWEYIDLPAQLSEEPLETADHQVASTYVVGSHLQIGELYYYRGCEYLCVDSCPTESKLVVTDRLEDAYDWVRFNWEGRNAPL